MPPRVVVVGGGISGLAAAYDLQRNGIETILFESQPRLGGVIETRSWQDCLLDCGPDSFISAKPEALALIKELGLESEVIGSNDHQRTTYILKGGKLVALPEGIMMMVPTKVMPMVRTGLLSWGTKLRMARELLRGPRTYPDRSVAEFVIDHFGEETLDYLAEPLLSGIYGGDPRELSVNSVLPRFVEMERRVGSLSRAVVSSRSAGPRSKEDSRAPVGFASTDRDAGRGLKSESLFRTLKGGLGTLVEALSRGLRVEHASVTAIARTDGNRFRVLADGQILETDHVILAGPAWSAGALARGFDGDLAGLLGAIPYSSSAIVSLIYKAAEFDGMRAGFGFLVPKRERKRLAAGTFVTTKFSFRAPENRIVLRCFFGGIGDGGALDETDESLVAMAREELRSILGLKAAPVHFTVARWPRSMAQYVVGHADRVREIQRRVAAIPGLHLAGNGYEGIGIPDCIRTGRRAAREVIGSQPGGDGKPAAGDKIACPTGRPSQHPLPDGRGSVG
jgi:protoporphyrinogen/coproporphyrinogen III oxidase